METSMDDFCYDNIIEEDYDYDVWETTQHHSNTEELAGVEGAKCDAHKWTDKQVRCLIFAVEQNFKDFDVKLKKSVWMQISKLIKETSGLSLSGQQCNSKWKLLNKKYRSIKASNNKTGHGSVKWPYFDMINSFLAERPEMNPVATFTSSSTTIKCTNKKSIPPQDETEASSSLENCEVHEPARKKIRVSDTERRHQERLQRQDKFLSLMENMIKKM